MPTIEQEIEETKRLGARRLYRKGDRVREVTVVDMGRWLPGSKPRTGTVYEDEVRMYRWSICVHWDGAPSPTGGPDDMLHNHTRIALVTPAKED